MSTRLYQVCAAVFGLVLCLPPSVTAREPEAFTLLGDEPGPAPSLAAVRSWQVAARFEVLRAAPPRLDLPLGAQEIRTAELVDFERRGTDDYTWRGRLTEGDGSVTLTVRGPALAGRIEAGRSVYEIVPRGRGASNLVLLDSDRFPECGTSAREAVAAEPSSATDGVAVPVSATRDSQAQIDVMVLYTANTRAGAGGTSNIQAIVQAAVDAANTAYGNSQITTRLRLVHTAEVTYDEAGTYSDHLIWVTSDPTVAELRETYRADLVNLMVEGGEFCGQAWLMIDPSPSFAGNAFSVTTYYCAVGNLSFAHELGHNMAAHHDPANDGGPSAFPFSYGHFVDGFFRTVMAYNTQCHAGCTRVSHFSNPNVSYLGFPTGIAEARDNHRTLNNTAGIVANFRRGSRESDFFTLTPCRVADTRLTSALRSGEVRLVPIAGICGIPADATAVALNVTVVGATGSGYLSLYPSGLPRPEPSVINFVTGAARANNAILPLPAGGEGTLAAEPLVGGGGSVHLVLDVSGYFVLAAGDI